tara:strand:- start:161 stop:301 length:141 start_codon:yes stop_codon:yes gene_type:complete
MKFPNKNILDESIKKYNKENPINGFIITVKVRLSLWWINLTKNQNK